MKIVYVVNTFPKISETFILNEIVQVQKQGINVEVFAFSDATEDRSHPDVSRVGKITYLQPAKRISAVLDHWYWLFKHPGRYLKTFLVASNRSNGITRWF